MILVTGDDVLEHNIYAGQGFTRDSYSITAMPHRKQPGGAMLTYGLLVALECTGTSSEKGEGAPSTASVSGVCASPREEL